MSRVLFAWELGGNFGHVGQFLPVAERLRADGHEVLFAVRDLPQAARFLEPRSFSYCQAPLFTPHFEGKPEEPESYAEILRLYGWGDVEEVTALIRGWRELYRWIRPDAVVGSHAPTALLAARGGPTARIALGTGFECPPAVSPLPSLRPWAQVPTGRLTKSETQVLETANAAVSALGCGSATSALCDLLQADDELLCSFPLLDHYGERRASQYLGALYTDTAGIPPSWPSGGGKRVFVYLRPQVQAFERLLADLVQRQVNALIFSPGISDALVSKYTSVRIAFAREPVRIADVATRCDLAIGHGGHGMSAAFLQAGVPLLFLPTQLEQYRTAWTVSRFGAGRLAPANAEDQGFVPELTELLEEPHAKAYAQSFRDRFGSLRPEAVAQRVATRIEAAIARRQPAAINTPAPHAGSSTSLAALSS
jgi:UDP:flavonoid glycosyltransferase YjiC (YdhE family)